MQPRPVGGRGRVQETISDDDARGMLEETRQRWWMSQLPRSVQLASRSTVLVAGGRIAAASVRICQR